jgi:EpsI family protein
VISWNARFAAVAVLLAGTTLFLQARARDQFVAPQINLSAFPVELKNWAGTDVPIAGDTMKRLGSGEFLQRTYKDQAGGADVDLYLAYLPTRSSLYHHLPQDCLAGSGWEPVKSDVTTLNFAGDKPFPANRYLIARGDDRQLVLFWYAAHGRRVASDNKMDFYLIVDALRLNRTDNALIRMNTEVRPGEKLEDAERRLLGFAGVVNPLLSQYIPFDLPTQTSASSL